MDSEVGQRLLARAQERQNRKRAREEEEQARAAAPVQPQVPNVPNIPAPPRKRAPRDPNEPPSEEMVKKLARLSELSYVRPDKRPKEEKGWHYDSGLSTPEVAVYFDNDDVVVASRGTEVNQGVKSALKDLANDFDIATGNRFGIGGLNDRIKSDRDIYERAKRWYPNKNLITTGHSLGGRISKSLAKRAGGTSVTFNAGQGLPSALDVECWFNKDGCGQIHNYRIKTDPLSLLGEFNIGAGKSRGIFDASAGNPHTIQNFAGASAHPKHRQKQGGFLNRLGQAAIKVGGGLTKGIGKAGRFGAKALKFGIKAAKVAKDVADTAKEIRGRADAFRGSHDSLADAGRAHFRTGVGDLKNEARARVQGFKNEARAFRANVGSIRDDIRGAFGKTEPPRPPRTNSRGQRKAFGFR